MNNLKETVEYNNSQEREVIKRSKVPQITINNTGTGSKIRTNNIKQNIMNLIKEQIGTYEVIASSSLCIFNYEDTILSLNYDGVEFKFRVKFIRNNSGSNIRIGPQNNEMFIEIMNLFTFPGGMNEPMVVLNNEDNTPAVSFLCSVLPFDKDSGNLILFYTFLKHGNKV